MKNSRLLQFPAIITIALLLLSCSRPDTGTALPGISVQNQGSHLSYLAKDGKPLLAFGCNLEHILFNDYDYERWVDWAADHGINHCRTRIFGSPTHNRPRNDLKYMPFLETENGKFDLTRWDQAYWERFHRIVSYYESKGIILHFLIFPQCTGGAWTNEAWIYHPDNNVNPETEFLRRTGSTEAFWQSWSAGKHDLFDVQMALVMKLIEETAGYDNIYYDLCHEPFLFTMTDPAREDFIEFMKEATRRFHEKYMQVRPDKMAVLGLDTDFVPPGRVRDWIYGHEGFNIMIKGNNNENWYTTDIQSVSLVKEYQKPFCPQESCDLPKLEHIPGGGHPQNLTYYYPHHRTHIRKYVWRWVMSRSQLIDVYQKGMGNTAEILGNPDPPDNERYEPYGQNGFEEDALILREFWNSLEDYPNLDFRGDIVKIHFKHTLRVLSSDREAVVYIASSPGVENENFGERTVRVQNLGLADGKYSVDIWKPSAPGGIIDSFSAEVLQGHTDLSLPGFTDDIALHIHQ